MEYALRQAVDADYDFLYQLKVACLKEYVAATWGWDEAYQQAHFAEYFNPKASQIIMVAGQAVGELSLRDREEEIYIAWRLRSKVQKHIQLHKKESRKDSNLLRRFSAFYPGNT